MEGNIRYFIRDDDVDQLTDALRGFVRTFAERGLPVSYQIIPALLTDECAEFMLGAERDYPGLVEFGQHGLHHQMTLGGRHLLREFGPERSLEQQQADIDEGQAQLKAKLGRSATVFTPPQHKYDRNTVIAAARAGHRVFSAAYYPTPHHQLIYALGRSLGVSSLKHHGISYNGRRRPEAALGEVSIAIDVDDGKAIRYAAADLGPAVDRASRVTSTIGFMFHHAMYQGAEGRASLARTADRLRDFGAERFDRLSELGEAIVQ